VKRQRTLSSSTMTSISLRYDPHPSHESLRRDLVAAVEALKQQNPKPCGGSANFAEYLWVQLPWLRSFATGICCFLRGNGCLIT
jgi:hypothetical protein